MAKRPQMPVEFGPFLLSFPCITAPDDKYGGYTANCIGDPNSPEMKQAKAILAEALKAFDLDPEDAKLPLVKEMKKDPNTPANARKPKKIPTGKLLLKNKSKYAPMVFDSMGTEINPKGLEIKGGTLAKVQGFLSPYELSGSEGISFTLEGVQILRMAEAGGRKAAGFAKYEGEGGGFVAGNFTGGDDLQLGSDDEDEAPEGTDGADEDDGGVLDI